jgi:predicted phosphodiesterase
MTFRSSLIVTLAISLGLAGGAGAQTPPDSSVVAAWVQLGAEGAEARAVIEGASCPAATVDGKPRPMAMRAAGGVDFPEVCALPLPAGAASVQIAGRPLALPRPARRIVVLGDTGCRLKGLAVQACNDGRAWPFAAVARLAAAQKPDLVIHVGDYYYRETACPPALKLCAGSPSGDRWGAWAADFFDPAQPLVAAAPWIFARGNHETCDRGGKGWTQLLDSEPYPADGACRPVSAAFTVHSGDLQLHVLDSGLSEDRGRQPDQVASIRAQIDRLAPALDHGAGWIITHRPVWGLVPVARIGPASPIEVGLNFTQQTALKGRTLNGVQMILSGHVHHFQAVDFGARRPAQLIVGTGGDVGPTADTATAYGGPRELDGMDADTFTFSRFGYVLLEKDGEDWTGTFHDAEDVVRASCRLRQRRLSCEESGAPRKAPPAG